MPFTMQRSGSVAVATVSVAEVITVLGTGKLVRDAKLAHAIPATTGAPGGMMDVPWAAKPRSAPHWSCNFPVTQLGPDLCVSAGLFCLHWRSPPTVTRLI